MDKPPAKRRFLELDGLRGIAALWVVIFHYTFGVRWFWLRGNPQLSPHVTPWAGNIEGLQAVDLFFIISGFVIFMTIRSSKTILDFCVSRFSRLYPAYWVSVLLTAAVAWRLPNALQPLTVKQVLANLTMLQAYVAVPAVDGVYWSLAFELGFYFLMALCYLSGSIKRIELLGIVWLAISFVTLKLFPAVGALIPWRLQALTALPYASLFFAGILFFQIWSLGPSFKRLTLVAVCFAEYVAFVPLKTALIGTGIFVMFSLCVFDRAKIFASRPLVFLGTISYALYLLHYAIGFRVMMFNYWLGVPPILNLPVTILAAILLATAVTFLVDKPGQALVRGTYKAWKARKASLAA